MNKIIEQQLKGIQIADMSNFDTLTNTYYIKKYKQPKYELSKCYLIKVNTEIVNNNNSLVCINWNKGIPPKHVYYKAYVTKNMGKMVYLDCIAFDFDLKQDLNVIYSGWFDINDLTQLTELEGE